MKKIEIIPEELLNMNKRRCFNDAVNFLDKSKGRSGRVLSLYGLRRTGKTILMRQLAYKYGIPYIYEVEPKDTMQDIEKILDKEKGVSKIVFIDEITNAPDFIEDSAILANYYASTGMDVVLAGTDSFGLYLAENNELLDRTYRINTTYISFAEHCEVLGVNDLDEYIEYGGLMRRGILDSEAVTDFESARRYLDSAVSNNIASSIDKVSTGISRFSEIEGYTKKDISLAIEKLVEIYNGVLSEKIVNKTKFKGAFSMPLSYRMKKEWDNTNAPGIQSVADMEALRQEYADILNLSCPLSKPATQLMVAELENAMTLVNLLSNIQVVQFIKENDTWEAVDNRVEKYIIQPAIKFHQLQEGAKILLESSNINTLNKAERFKLKEQLTNDIYGKMSENITLYDTRKSLNNNYVVCKPYFQGEINGEYDMIVYDCNDNSYYAFEIKHSNKAVVGYDENGAYIGQDKHLLNQDFRKASDWYFGKCNGVVTLYNGENFISPQETYYINLPKFLRSIDKTKNINQSIKELTTNIPVKIETDLIDENPNIRPFPVNMDNVPLKCQSDLHRLILLHHEQFASDFILRKMKKKYPVSMEKITQGDIHKIIVKYKDTPSFKTLCGHFKRTCQGKNFEANFNKSCLNKDKK